MVDLNAASGPAISAEVLPAAYGDCLLVSCRQPGGTWRMLFDTGPSETWPILSRRLAEMPVDAMGRRHIDLVVVSHIDHDHIGAAQALFADESLGLSFGDVWFNGRRHLGDRSAGEAETLSKLLGARERTLPWNLAFQGQAVATAGDGTFVEVASSPGGPRITILSPTPKRLAKVVRVWDAELERLRRKQPNTETERAARPEGSPRFPDLPALAAQESDLDDSPTNGSSIAILLEHRGASILLAADAFATVLGSALLGLAEHRELSPPLRVDAFKLSHHGSRANLMTKLLATVRASNYIVSTDNTRFGHPDDEALARVVLFGGESPTLWFNHATDQNRRWSDEVLQRNFKFATRFPAVGECGVTLPLREQSGPAA